MQGSLDNSPVIVRSAPTYWAVQSLSAFALGFYFLNDLPINSTLSLYLVAIIAALGRGVWCLFRIVRTQHLEISPQGLVWFDGLETTAYAWWEIERVSLLPGLFSKQIGLTLMEDDASRFDAVFPFCGNTLNLGGHWEIRSTAIVEMLREGQRRWGTAYEPSRSMPMVFGMPAAGH